MTGLRGLFLASALLFGLGGIAGVAVLETMPEAAGAVSESIAGFVETVRGLSRLQLFVFIFLNNALKTLVMMFGGLLLGLAPVFFLVFNGLAFAIVAVQMGEPLGTAVTVAALAPHGMIEIPAVLLGAAVGLRLGIVAWHRLRGRGEALSSACAAAFRFFVRVLAPLFGLAAAIETWITPVIVAVVRA